MSSIDWGAVRPQGSPTAGQEVASIGGLLSAIVERRQKALEFQEQQELAVRRHEQEVRHQTELEDNNRRMLASQEAHQTAVLQQQKDLAKQKAEEAQRVRSQAALPSIYDAVQAGNNDKAGMIARGAGGSVDSYLPPMDPVPSMFRHVPVGQGDLPAQPPPSPMAIEPPPMPGAGLPPMASPEDRGPPAPPQAPPPPAVKPYPTTIGQAAGEFDDMNPDIQAHFAALPSNQQLQNDTKGMQEVRLPGLQLPADPGIFMSDRADAMNRIKRGETEGRAASDRIASTFNADTPIKRQALLDMKGYVNSGSLLPGKAAAWLTAEIARKEQMENATKNAYIGRQATGGNQDKNHLQKGASALDRSLKQWDNVSSSKKLTASWGAMREAEQLIKSGTAPGQKGGIDAFIAAKKNGTVTKQALEYMANNMSGGMGQIESAIEHVRTGQYGTRDVREMTKAIGAAMDAIHEHVESERQAFVDSFYDPMYAQYKQNVNSAYNARFIPFGYPANKDQDEGVTPEGERLKADPKKKAANAAADKSTAATLAQLAKLAADIRAKKAAAGGK